MVDHKEYGEVLQFQGDQREKIKSFMLQIGLVADDKLKMHGF